MLMDPETRACVLAEVQMRSDAWRHPDPDERVECDVHECVVCTKPLVGTTVWHAAAQRFVQRKPTIGQKVCRVCSQEGWRQMPCVVCAGPTRSWNWTSKIRQNKHRGWCPKCRQADNRDQELTT